MGVWSVLFMSAMPVFRLLVHVGLGAYLSSPQSNVMPADARKHINKLVFVCFMPSLVFSNLAQTVTVEKMLEWWFMPINVFLCYLIGAGIGICIFDHFKPPEHLKRLIIACCAAGNSSNLPLVLISAICKEAGSPFGKYDVCTANGVAYISYGLWMATVLTWTVVFNYLKPKPEPGYEQVEPQHAQASSEDDDAGHSSRQQPLALLASKDLSGYQGSQGFQGPQGFSVQAPRFHGSQEFQPQGFLNSQAPQGFAGGFSRDSGMFSGPQAFQGGFPGAQGGFQGFQRGSFQNPAYSGPQGFQQGPQPFAAMGPRGFPGGVQAPQSFQTGPRHSQGFDDYNDGSQGFSGPYQNTGGFQFQPQGGFNQGFNQVPLGPQMTQGPGFSAAAAPPSVQATRPTAQAGTSRNAPAALPPQEQQLQPLTDDFSLTNLRLWADKYGIIEAFTPPTTAAALAIPIGAVPFFRHLLYGHQAPFRFLGDALVILGEAMIPCMNLLLGGNLSQGFGASELQIEVVICIMLTRLLLLPIAGLIVVKLAFSMGLVPADPLFHFVLLLQFTMPTAINVDIGNGTMTQLFGVGQTECSIILFWCYTSSVVFLTLWTMIFLVLLI